MDEFVTRLHRIIERFTAEHGLQQAQVEVHLFDGTNYKLAGLSPEPGFGFLTLTPIVEDGDPPLAVVVPVGALRAFEVSVADTDAPLGFAPDETPAAAAAAAPARRARKKEDTR